MVADGQHRLGRTWVLWEHRKDPTSSKAAYGESMRCLCDFATVEAFWQHWCHLPSPSVLFSAASEKRSVNALSLFISGIRPEWEDPANAAGGELFLRKSAAPHELDRLWHQLVLAVVGASLEGAHEHVTGVRIANKSVKGRSLYRLELWLRSEDVTEPMRAALVSALREEVSEPLLAQPLPPRCEGERTGPPPLALHSCFRRALPPPMLQFEYKSHQLEKYQEKYGDRKPTYEPYYEKRAHGRERRGGGERHSAH